jgi:hypothetical protein
MDDITETNDVKVQYNEKFDHRKYCEIFLFIMLGVSLTLVVGTIIYCITNDDYKNDQKFLVKCIVEKSTDDDFLSIVRSSLVNLTKK